MDRLRCIKLEESGGKNLALALETFFCYDTKSTNNKRKNKQVGLHQTKKFLQEFPGGAAS